MLSRSSTFETRLGAQAHPSRSEHKRTRAAAVASPDTAQQFRHILGDEGLIQDSEKLKGFNTDWTGQFRGHAPVVLQPGSTAEVSAVLQHCNEHKIAVVPQGGNTGLAGACVPHSDEVILTLHRMNSILEMTPEGVLVCEAGCTLLQADEHARQQGHTVPLDLAPKDTCQIGGNLATNAAGLRFLRYGSLRGNVVGVEAVLADGTVLDCLKTVRKDNTGYDLKQLFIGSEGTLGVITKVALQCAPRMPHVVTSFMAVPSFEAVQEAHQLARQALPLTLSAFEFLDRASVELCLQHVEDAHNPFGELYPMYVLIELAGTSEDRLQEDLQQFAARAQAAGCVQQAKLAMNSDDAANLWSIRRGVAESLSKHGQVYKYDLSMPLRGMYGLVEAVRERVKQHGDTVKVTGFGHVGDGNLHLNISDGDRRPDEEMRPVLEPFVYEWTSERGGSVSAEHGIGALKRHVLHLSQPPAAVHLMAQIKAMMDPNGILNPRKILPDRMP